MNPHQSRDRGGRFDTVIHPEADVRLFRPAASSRTSQTLERRDDLHAQVQGLRTRLAAESAAAIASHTRDVFPDAQYLEITADDVEGNGARVTTIRGTGDKPLAGRGGSSTTPSEAYSRWASAQDAEHSIPSLISDIAGQAGNLGEAVTLTSTPRRGNFGVYAGGCTFTLNIDKALDLNRSSAA